MKKKGKKVVAKKKVKKAVRAEKKENKLALIPYNSNLACLLLEKVEDKLIRKELDGEYVDKMCCAITKKDEKTGIVHIIGYEVLYTGYREIARVMSEGKKKYLFHFNEPKETFLADLKQWVVRVEAVNIETGENNWGGAEVKSYFESGKPYEFSYRSALTKAQRNALKPLIPLEIKLRMLKEWKKDQKKVLEVPYSRTEAIETSEELKNTDHYRKGIHARLSELKIDPKRWHEFVCYDQTVKSFNDIPSAILSNLFKELMQCKDPQTLKDYLNYVDWIIQTKGLEKEKYFDKQK